MSWRRTQRPVKRVITYGSFDLLHYGHISLLRRAKSLGHYLIVGLSTESFSELKGKQTYFTYEEREQLLEAVRYVDLVIPETRWEQKVDDIKEYHIDVFVMGDDWQRKFDFLRDYCEVVYLPRTPEVSTTQIKNSVDLRSHRRARQAGIDEHAQGKST
jgi:glycerol-3-phosphate cytidylyltransferase